MKILRYGLAIAIIIAIAISAVGCSSGPKEPLAATVNGKNITMADIDLKLKQMVGQNQEALVGPQGQQVRDQYSASILDELIDMEIMLQEADNQGISVTGKEVDAKIKEMMKTYGIKSQKDLETILKQSGTTLDQFKDEFSNRLKIEKLGDKFAKDIKISDKKVKEYYDTHKAEFVAKDQVHVKHILVQKEDLAKKIIADLQKGADFDKLAKQNSIDTKTKDKGGDLSWVDKDGFVPPFADACWKLNAGELTLQPLKTDFGFHVIKLVGKKASYQKKFSEVKKDIKDRLLRDKTREEFNETLEKLRKKADIEKFLKPSTAGAPGAAPGVVEPGDGSTQGQQIPPSGGSTQGQQAPQTGAQPGQ